MVFKRCSRSGTPGRCRRGSFLSIALDFGDDGAGLQVFLALQVNVSGFRHGKELRRGRDQTSIGLATENLPNRHDGAYGFAGAGEAFVSAGCGETSGVGFWAESSSSRTFSPNRRRV
jgi:hypothetical protein